MKKNPKVLQKIASSSLLIAILLVIGISSASLNKALGWTDPSGDPPIGSGAITAIGSNVGINHANPTSTLAVNGPADFFGNTVSGVAAPIAGQDAVNKSYLETRLASSSGGSVALYYRTSNGGAIGGPEPTCPDETWTEAYRGYGPHYLAVFTYDWLSSGTGGNGGGFGADPGGEEPPPPPPPVLGGAGSAGPGQSYVLDGIEIVSDSVCSNSKESSIYVSQSYLNATTSGSATLNAQACAINPTTGFEECNRCLVCYK